MATASRPNNPVSVSACHPVGAGTTRPMSQPIDHARRASNDRWGTRLGQGAVVSAAAR
ncbi:hypothetical protein POSPLADRAFT_1063091 [Postia placenta MAD-698-R-SB12]|uniref:Uncharacterized protein n=1 Tax=Postia placenta MAD-698-R-SB12 TaxID=670580 RepID=A0A1X6MHX6_9APHY|nr:hypothetical protein POSPLADRAFT_1063091 [Postia placenta MAD-698-R-SB12]OSX56014.1 hypothetical protein POSPLADRAFT_1063091 [Postia placenta MAD-698-R-SB12]